MNAIAVCPGQANSVHLEAFHDHGRVRASLEEDLWGAHNTMETLAQMHISMTEVAETRLDGRCACWPHPSINGWRPCCPGRCNDHARATDGTGVS
jgi:hypothetical protein